MLRSSSIRNCLGLAVLVSVLAGSSALQAETLRVPSQYPTIQAAVNAANTGDEVVVADGRYTGDGNRDVNFLGKAIAVRSESGNPDACIIDCEGSEQNPHIGFYFDRGEGPDSVLDGFTIVNGYLDLFEIVAIYASGSNPTISGNVFVNNGIGFGGNISDILIVGNVFKDFSGFDRWAMRVSGTGSSKKTITIRDNTFCDFSGDDYTAIEVSGTSSAVNTVIVTGNIFRDFSGSSPFCGAVSVSGTGSAVNTGVIEWNRFENIGGYAIRLSGTGSATIHGHVRYNMLNQCGSSNNAAIDIGGTGTVTIHAQVANNLIAECRLAGIEISGISGSRQYGEFVNNTIVKNNRGISRGGNVNELKIANEILWDNGDDLVNVLESQISYCDISDGDFNGRNGNISEDPKFVDPGTGDYRLGAGSPCIDAADNFAVPPEVTTDLDGNPRFVDDPDTPDTGKGDPPIVDMGTYEFQVGGCNGNEKITKAKCKTKKGKVKKVVVVVKKATPGADYTAKLDTGEELIEAAKSSGKVKFKFKGDNAPPCGPNGVSVCAEHKDFDCGC